VKTRGVKGMVEANKIAKVRLNFFATKDVDFKRKQIYGTYYDYEKNHWKKKLFPLPDVLYMRGGSGRIVEGVVKRFDDLGIPRLNALVAFNKGELFSDLKKDEIVRPYLPYTKMIEDLGQVRKYIRRYGTVYIKACRGSRGTKVMKVEKVKHDGYRYSYSVLGDLVRDKTRHFDSLKKKMGKFFNDRKVIVQEAINLVKVDHNRPVDFRAELQRNGKGDLEIVAVPIRVGQRNSPITTHGEAYHFSDYLVKLFPDYTEERINGLKKEIESFLIKVYKSVERKYGKFGEIGIDFGVDINGNVRLIECNAQSAKVSIGKAYGSKQIYLNPLEYAKRLAKKRR
jgi:hypothetical protein